MNKTLIAALVAAGQLLLAQPARAITFTFSWRSDANGLTLVEGGPVHEAAGTVDINVQSGQPFTARNITNVDITVTDGTNTIRIPQYNFVWDKIVDGSGTFASTTDIALLDGTLVDQPNQDFFGCDNNVCTVS